MRREVWPRVYLSGRVLHSACALIPSCSDPTSDGQVSVFQCHPWIGNADTHSTRRIYSRVAITHLLHRMSPKRTHYNQYGLRPSNTITAEGLEDKSESINSNGIAECMTTTYRTFTRLKSPQHNTLQPENGSAHGICWHSNTVEQRTDKCYHYMHIWLVEALWIYDFAKSQFFPTTKE